MTRTEKANAIEELKEKFANCEFFYLTDASTLTVGKVNELRRKCFENNIEMQVVKNSLAIKALESAPVEKGYAGLYDALKGPTAVLFTKVANAPAKLLAEFRKDAEKPSIKAAYIDTAIFLGDDSINTLKTLKSREELVGDIIGLLQSPAKNVISALKSGGSIIAGLVKTLEERGN